MTDLQQFRERALQALQEMNTRIDTDKAGAEAERLAAQAERGIRRARSALHGTKVSIAAVVAVAAATASIWDLMRLMDELGADARWGIVAGGAIDLGWIYYLLEIYSHREDPAKALKPYARTTRLLILSAVLNGLSGVLAGGHGLGAVVLGVVSVLMPLLLKGVITPLVLGGSLAGELLTSRQGRSRVGTASRDRQGRALAAFDAAYRLESERAEHSAQIELQRQRAVFEVERESIALELQRSREDLARAAFEASTTEDAPAAVASVTGTATGAPALPVASATPGTLPGGVTPEQLATLLAAMGHAAGGSDAASATDDAASATDDAADAMEDDDLEPLEPPTLASLSKADAVRIALRRRPDYTGQQIADLLAAHGVTVTDSYVRQVRLRDQRATDAVADATSHATGGDVVPMRKNL